MHCPSLTTALKALSKTVCNHCISERRMTTLFATRTDLMTRRNILPFAPNVTLRNTRWPETTPWEQICSERRAMPSSNFAGGSSRQRHHETKLLRLLASGAPLVDGEHAVLAFADRLRRDLGARGVLCDGAQPCAVSVSTDGDNGNVTAEICLPRLSSAARRAVLCEPYGEMWQQLGGEVDLFDGRRSRYKAGWKGDKQFTGDLSGAFDRPACASFELRRLARWWTALRTMTPFLNASQLQRGPKANGKLSTGWPLRGKQSKGAAASAEKQSSDQARSSARSYARSYASMGLDGIADWMGLQIGWDCRLDGIAYLFLQIGWDCISFCKLDGIASHFAEPSSHRARR